MEFLFKRLTRLLTYHFIYHINKVALYWQEKSTLLMNENERIDTPNKNLKRVDALKMKHALNHNKNKQRA